MFGVFLFWIHYIVAIIILYTILRCSYKYVAVKKEYRNYEYKKSNERVKFPLWIILLFIAILFIPVVNLIIYIAYMIKSTNAPLYDINNNRVYYKSFLTKEY